MIENGLMTTIDIDTIFFYYIYITSNRRLNYTMGDGRDPAIHTIMLDIHLSFHSKESWYKRYPFEYRRKHR